jgi:Flp pilus assembly protein TadD
VEDRKIFAASAARLSTACIALLLLMSGCNKNDTPSNDASRSKSPLTSTAEFTSLFARAAEKLTPLVQTEEPSPRRFNAKETAEIQSSIADLEACVAYSTEHWQSMVLLAKAHQSLHNHRDSLDWWVKAMKIETANHILPKEASITALHLSDIDAALRFSAEALRRKPDDPALMGNHAMNLLIAGRDREAMAAIITALAFAPDDAFNQRISKVIYQVGVGERARPTCESALK